MFRRRKQDPGFPPWGRAAGLLVACAATVAGAVQGTGPTHLLYRAVIGGILSAFVVNTFVRLVLRSTPEPKSRRRRTRGAQA